MINEGYAWMAHERPQPHAVTAPLDAGPEDLLAAAHRRRRADSDDYTRQRRTARDIRLIKRLAVLAVALLAVLVLGTSAGAALWAVTLRVPVHVVRTCESIITRC
jgi:hypothetical protein